MPPQTYRKYDQKDKDRRDYKKGGNALYRRMGGTKKRQGGKRKRKMSRRFRW